MAWTAGLDGREARPFSVEREIQALALHALLIEAVEEFALGDRELFLPTADLPLAEEPFEVGDLVWLLKGVCRIC